VRIAKTDPQIAAAMAGRQCEGLMRPPCVYLSVSHRPAHGWQDARLYVLPD